MGFLIRGGFLSSLLTGFHIWYCKLEIAQLKCIAVLIQRCNSRKLCINKLAGGGGFGFIAKYPNLTFKKKIHMYWRNHKGGMEQNLLVFQKPFQSLVFISVLVEVLVKTAHLQETWGHSTSRHPQSLSFCSCCGSHHQQAATRLSVPATSVNAWYRYESCVLYLLLSVQKTVLKLCPEKIEITGILC